MHYNIPRSKIVVDEDGVGGGIVDHLGCTGFVNGSKASNKRYKNLNTECYYKLSEMVNEAQIYISANGEREQITEELEIIKRANMDSDNKLEIITKEKMKDLLGRSPDFADTLMMRMVFDVKQQRKMVHW